MCAAEALSMLGFATYPALLTDLRDHWGLSATEAGLIAGAFFGGYMLAVPVLSGLTDRSDARRVFAGGCLLGAAGTLGFALLASGTLTGAFFQALAGAGLAGTYMPGLRALTDRVGGRLQSRYIAFYTSTFGIGTSLSLAFAGALNGPLPWQWVFGLAAAGPLLAGVMVLRGLDAHAPPGSRLILDPRPTLRNAEARRFVVGYAVHCWELFGLRSWMVAFLAMAFAAGGSALPSAANAAAAINLLGIPASILGNELAMRIGRMRLITRVMTGSALLAPLAGLSGLIDPWLAFAVVAAHFVFVMADSASLTAGLVAATPPMQRGAAMAVYSLGGFGAGFVSPLVFGALLDSTGDGAGWVLAFASLGAGCGAVALVSWRRSRASNAHTDG